MRLGLCPVAGSTGYVEMRTRVQFWTRVRILAYPVELATRHKSHSYQ